MSDKGLTLGKFMPFHKGHEFLLKVALSKCDDLTILIGTTPDDPVSFATRRRWLTAYLYQFNKLSGGYATLEILEDPDPNPMVKKDDYGTVMDESYWSAWISQNSETLDKTDIVFTSDRYGKEIANRIDAKWLPVDPDREIFPISSTEIRNQPYDKYSFISDIAKPHYCKTVAVIGAESTGKSTLVQSLADYYGISYAPEYGRIAYEGNPDLDESDFDDILHMQHLMIRAAQLSTPRGLCITDTEAIVTDAYASDYLGHSRTGAQGMSVRQDIGLYLVMTPTATFVQDIGLYLVMTPTATFVQDGTRHQSQEQREQFHTRLITVLEDYGFNYKIIDGSNYRAREVAAMKEIDAFID